MAISGKLAGKISGLALAGVIAAGTALAPAGDAFAGHRHHHGYYNNGGAAVAAGIAGVLLGTALATPRYYVEPAPVYVAPRRVYIDPAPEYVEPYYGEQVYDDPYYGDDEVYVQPRQPYSEYRRTEPQRVLPRTAPPRAVTYDEEPVGSINRSANLSVGSADWVSYCQSKYRSFDRRTGTFLGHDGNRHMCAVR
jgi:hypothetical protein